MGSQMSGLSGNGRTAPAVYAGMRIALAWGLLASSIAATSCVVNVDSQALIEREEKRFSVKGTPIFASRPSTVRLRCGPGDRPDVLVEIEKRGPTREAVDGLVVQVEQDGNRIAVEVKRPKSETFSGFGVPSIGLGETDRVRSAELGCRRPERRWFDQDRARDRQA